MSTRMISRMFITTLLLTLFACDKELKPKTRPKAEVSGISNRISVSNDIISNLGITFQKVLSGKLGVWITVPGKLEVSRENRYAISAPARGRIFWVKERLNWVSSGEVLATIESTALSQTQQELAAARQSLIVARKAKRNNNGSLLRFSQAERKYRETLGKMAVLTGLSSDTLEQEKRGAPYWSTIKKLEVRSPGDGFLFEVSVSNGELLEEGTPVGLVLDVTRLVFRGLVAPSIFAKIPANALIRVKVSDATVVESQLKGPLPIGDRETSKVWLEAHVPNGDKQLIDGSAVIAHVQIRESEFEEAIVSESCVVFDELQVVIFKRDAVKPDFVIRTPVEVGNRSGGQLEILSGVLEGDEIVCDGIHQLRYIGAGKAPEGGHFHADGTWHKGDE